jgi:hypothetical protein
MNGRVQHLPLAHLILTEGASDAELFCFCYYYCSLKMYINAGERVFETKLKSNQGTKPLKIKLLFLTVVRNDHDDT